MIKRMTVLALLCVSWCAVPASEMGRGQQLPNSAAEVESEDRAWRVAGGEIVIELNHGVLDPLRIDAVAVHPAWSSPDPFGDAYSRYRFEGLSVQAMSVEANRNRAIQRFSDGYLHYHGGFVLDLPRGRIDLTDFRVTPDPGQHGQFLVQDQFGRTWAHVDHGHYEILDDRRHFEIRHANLTMSESMASLLEIDGMAGQVIGVVHLRAEIVHEPALAETRGACSVPNWPTDPGFEADVALTDMSQTSTGAVQFFRCIDCNGASGGPMVLAPNATLSNVGSADVPWWQQFTSPQPPYGNDQHPYLVWNLYRMEADGRLLQIATSGVKHAFYSVNSDCDCPGGNILWVGCSDTYGAANNDADQFLAPRSEIVPASGLWGRCNSFFDPDCDAAQEGYSTGGYVNRMNVMEEQIAPSSHPGARFFVEAWYVVRDDIDIFNTRGFREVTPTWNGSMWTFPGVGGFQQGTVADLFVASGTTQPTESSQRVESADGTFRIDVRVDDLGSGAWRYTYFVTNFDFMRADSSGAEPDLELLTNLGFVRFDVSIAADASVSESAFSPADPINDAPWSFSRPFAGTLRWQDPGGTSLNWSEGFRYSFVSDIGPAQGSVRLTAAFGAPADFEVAALVPGRVEEHFSDGFESAN